MTLAKTTGVIAAGTARKLRRYNLVMGLLHLAQGVAIIALANSFAIPVVGTFLTDQPGAAPPSLTSLFEVRLAGASPRSCSSPPSHTSSSSAPFFPRYIRGLEEKRNYFRWIEYSISSSIMIVLIALLVGILDIAALIALAGVNAAMILFGLLQEKYETPGKGVNWTAYWFGAGAGAIPWIAIALYLVAPGVDASPPGFVYGIFFSLFIFFNCFAVVMVLQYKKVGKWASYEYGESTYVLLSLVAKSLLAWQVFAGTLAG